MPRQAERSCGETGDELSVDLSKYHGQNRLLIVFGPSAEDVHYKTQMAEMAVDQDGLEERDVVMLTVVHDGVSKEAEEVLTAAQAAALRIEFDVAPDSFMVVLVGKDGAVKLQKDRPVTMRELFDKIDSMPMRQAEMKAR